MEPTPKSEPLTEILEGFSGRSTAVELLKCVDKPVGCGQEYYLDVVNRWSPMTIREYRISGLCKSCQEEFFGEEDC